MVPSFSFAAILTSPFSLFFLAFTLPIASCFTIPSSVGINRNLKYGRQEFISRIVRDPHSQNKRFRSAIAVSNSNEASLTGTEKGRILVLGGNGFLGSNVAKRAILEGYQVTSLSRRGDTEGSSSEIDYVKGDARDITVIENILASNEYVAVIHCVGLLFDINSGLARYNRLASGSKSLPDENSTYDSITRLTAFNSIDATRAYGSSKQKRIPFLFASAAEADWPNVRGGKFVEKNLAPEWLRRYLRAKRAVESKLLNEGEFVRGVIFRPSLIYSIEKIPSLPAVLGFIVGNKVGLPFVDRPVQVSNLVRAMIRSVENENVEGVLNFRGIDELNRD